MSNPPVVDLDDDAALETSTVGAKAARLAAARRAGPPVLRSGPSCVDPA
jgi:hypothetical protein